MMLPKVSRLTLVAALIVGMVATTPLPAMAAGGGAQAATVTPATSPWQNLDDWTIDSGTWKVNSGALTGEGSIRSKFCTDCTPRNPLVEARATVQVVMPSAADATKDSSIDVAFRNGEGLNSIGVRLSDLGASTVTASMFSNVNGTTNLALGAGSRSTVRTLPLAPGSVQNVELEWKGNIVFYRIWSDGKERPGAPLGGYILDAVNISPDSLELASTDLTATFRGSSVTNIVSGYPSEAPPVEPAPDRNAWETLSGQWTQAPPGTLTGTSDGSDAAVLRPLCATCIPGDTASAGTATTDFTVPLAPQLADPTWASASLMLTGTAQSRRIYVMGMVGTQSKLTLMNVVNGSESRVREESFAWTAGVTYRIELHWSGATHEVRVWPIDAARPASPQINATVDDFKPEFVGYRQWGVKSASYSNLTVEDLTISPAPSVDPPSWARPTAQGVYFPTTRNIVPVPTYDELRPSIPTPVADDDPHYLDMYNESWKILLRKNVLQPEATSPLVRTYVDAGFDRNIMFQWDTLFSLQYAMYAHAGFDAIASLDNWYVLQKPTGEIRRAYDSRTGQVHGWAGGPNGVNPPLFAWVELANYQLTGDIDRVTKVLPALRAYADWVSVQMWSQATPHQLFWNNGNGNGMDNLPTQLGQGGDGGNNGVGNVDMSSQMALMRNSLAELEDAVGQTSRSQDDRAWADSIAQQVRDVSWNEDDGRFYEVDAAGKQWKVDSLAGFWTMLSGVATPAQSERMTGALADPDKYWGDMVFPTLARSDSRFDPKGDYWRGGVWAPSTFATIKGVEASGDRELAMTSSRQYLNGILEVFEYSGTLFETYAPDKQSSEYISNSSTGRKSGALRPIVKAGTTLAPGQTFISPGTDEAGSRLNSRGGSDNISKDDFVGWTGLAPITLLIENIIGIQANVPDAMIDWDLHRTDRHGIENLNLGTLGTISMIADPRADAAADTNVCFSGSLNSDVTVRMAIAERLVPITLPSGIVDTCKNTVEVPEPTGNAKVTLAQDKLRHGETQTATGTGFVPGETVTAVMHSTPLAVGSQTASTEGEVTFSWVIPAGVPAGQHKIALTGTITPEASATFEILAGEGGSGNGSDAGGLPITGAHLWLAVIGGVLAIIGAVVLLEARRARFRDLRRRTQ